MQETLRRAEKYLLLGSYVLYYIEYWKGTLVYFPSVIRSGLLTGNMCVVVIGKIILSKHEKPIDRPYWTFYLQNVAVPFPSPKAHSPRTKYPQPSSQISSSECSI